MARPLPPVYFFFALVGMTLAHFTHPIARVVHPPWTYLGIPILIAALVVVVWAARLFNRSETSIKPFERSSALVTHGPYRMTRNPMYLGLVLVLSGVACLFGSLSPFLVIPVFALLIQEKFIKVEEEMLAKTFTQRYREYRQRVRRWI